MELCPTHHKNHNFLVLQYFPKCQNKMRICSWNVEGCSLGNASKLEQLKLIMKEFEIGILCMQEMYFGDSIRFDSD